MPKSSAQGLASVGNVAIDERVASIVRETAHLYSNIVDWYVLNFFDDLTDAEWLGEFRKSVGNGRLVVDVGSGPGHFAQHLTSLGLRTIATDLAIPMVVTSHTLVPDVPAVASDMRYLPFRDGVFDGLLCAYVFAHIPAEAAPAVLHEFARVMAEGGVLQMMTKCGIGSYTFDSTLVPGASGFVQLWSVDDLSRMIAVAGFDILQRDDAVPSSPHEFDHPKSMILARRRPRPVVSD
jgi:SAM-dependent methyltransferase